MRFTKGEQPEAILVRQAKSGDFEAFASLYQVYLNAIYRYVYYRINHAQDAQDLTEKVFQIAWEALPVFEEKTQPFSSWLYSIANPVILEYQQHKKENVIEVSSTVAPISNPAGLLKQVNIIQEVEILSQAISKLKTEQQQVIIFRYIEGLNQIEVSRILAKSLSACRKLQFQALSALDQILSTM